MQNYHLLEKAQVLQMLRTSENGLTESEVSIRLKQNGTNELVKQDKKGIFSLFLAQLRDLMVLLLIGAACISAVIAFVTKDKSELLDTFIILLIVIVNATVGVIQEYRADKAIDALKKLATSEVKVRRNGSIQLVPSENIVPGDIVLLKEGDRIPADIRLLQATYLKADESALTGESHATDKIPDPLPMDSSILATHHCMLFSSTFIVQGHGEGVVTACGMKTEIGKIANQIDQTAILSTPLQQSLNKLGKLITIGVVAIALILFVFGLIFKRASILEQFMTAIALAVAAIPEGLPAVVTIIMAMGVQRMSRKHAIIRKLHAVETLGSCDVICSDKTGTLTENQMRVQEIYTNFLHLPATSQSVPRELLLAMSLCNNSKVEKGKYLGDPTERALKMYADQFHLRLSQIRLSELPFDSTRKMMSVTITDKNVLWQYTKGAPDFLLPKCTQILEGTSVRQMTRMDTAQIIRSHTRMASKALRVLALAYKPMPSSQIQESELIFIGLVGIIDPPRPEVKLAVEQCRLAHITPVMITGDHKDTAFAIAEQLGIAKTLNEVMTGEQLEALSAHELNRCISKIHVFARVNPAHKTRIVKALQANGHVVAMTGDGINDAPSIKNADIGIAMGISGTDVTKNASDMIIADDNFATIIVAVREGRRIFANIHKTIQFYLATNIAEVLSIFFITLFFHACDFLESTQLLWINLITDTLPVLALSAEKADRSMMECPPEKATNKLFSRASIYRIATYGLIQTILIIGLFVFSLPRYGNAVATTMSFFALSFIELFHSFNIRSEKDSLFSRGLFSNPLLFLTAFLGIGINILLYSIPPLRAAFSLVPLQLYHWLLIFAVSFAVVPFSELYKLGVRHHKRKQKISTKSPIIFPRAI